MSPGETPIPTGKGAGWGRFRKQKQSKCQGEAATRQLSQLVPCLCCAEPRVDVSVLAIKILNEEVSSL